MVIREFDDIYKLLNERVEVMEDLNCKELHDCVEAFISLSGLVSGLRMINDLHSVVPCAEYKDAFEEGKNAAVAAVRLIDQLTLKTDAAE